MVISLLRCWLSELGDAQLHSVNHSPQDISASVVKEVVIQKEQGGPGGVAAKKGEKKKKGNLHSTELMERGNGNMLNTNLKMTLDWLKVCKVNTRGVLSVTLMINTVLCGICGEGFSEAKKQLDGKKEQREKNINMFHKPDQEDEDIATTSGLDTTWELRKAGKGQVSVTLSNVRNNPSDSGKAGSSNRTK